MKTRNSITRSYRSQIYNSRMDMDRLQSLVRIIENDSDLEETRKKSLLKTANHAIDAILNEFEFNVEHLAE